MLAQQGVRICVLNLPPLKQRLTGMVELQAEECKRTGWQHGIPLPSDHSRRL